MPLGVKNHFPFSISKICYALTMRPQLLSREQARQFCRQIQDTGRKVVFTNGCFDILHRGHVTYLEFARAQGDVLIVGLNSDTSVRRLKGPTRPVNNESDRAYVLCGLRAVDAVVVFDEDEPRDLIAAIDPDVLVKGKDWAHYVSGRDIVEARGGRVVLADMVEGHSTTATIEKVKS